MRERLTTDKTKIFARENPTLMSMSKSELRNHYNEIFDRLQEYEVAEETGQLIVPPCKVDDKVYLPSLNDWGDIENYTITEIVLDNDGLCFVVDDEDREAHSIEILGKEVFLTKEEAEKALRGVQE